MINNSSQPLKIMTLIYLGHSLVKISGQFEGRGADHKAESGSDGRNGEQNAHVKRGALSGAKIVHVGNEKGRDACRCGAGH